VDEFLLQLSSFAQMDFAGQSAGLWAAFLALVFVLLAIDLGVLNRKDKVIEAKESLLFSAGYACLAILFGIWMWNDIGANQGLDYFTAYVIELSLSLDNLFVMSVVLSYFAIPRKYQHRVLFWGILGVLVMRGLMIGVGTAAINSFHWLLYFFAAFLIVTGVKMLFMKDDDDGDLKDSALIRFFQKHLRFTKEISGHQFFVRLPDEAGKMVLFATPLFMALICIEFMDVLFALDSVPAVLAITTDPFVVYTSNIFAILGLRSMYFAMAAMLERFKYLKYALSIVLIFIGGKVFYNGFIGKIDPLVSLLITVGVLAAGAVFSLSRTKNSAQ
jgi:tellurite resistance protein TerC